MRKRWNNSKVVLKLQEAGDKLDKPRIIDHWLNFKTEKDRQNFITLIQPQGYKVVAKEKAENEDYPFQLHLTRYDKADLQTMCKTTLHLRKEAINYNGMYDGWESVVVR